MHLAPLAMAPTGMAAPAGLFTVFLAANCVIAACAVIAAEIYRQRTAMLAPLLLLAGGGLTVFNEASLDRLGLCWFPTVNAPPSLYHAFGVSVPLFMLPVYIWYVGGQAALCYILLRRKASVTRLLGLYATFAAVNVLLEAPALNLSIYAYYGAQPLRLFLFPCWWAIANGLMPIALAVAARRFEWGTSRLHGLVFVVACPVVAFFANALTVSPVWWALNRGLPIVGTRWAALISLSLGVFVALLIARVAATSRSANPMLLPPRPLAA